jgi:hypothetical protein
MYVMQRHPNGFAPTVRPASSCLFQYFETMNFSNNNFAYYGRGPRDLGRSIRLKTSVRQQHLKSGIFEWKEILEPKAKHVIFYQGKESQTASLQSLYFRNAGPPQTAASRVLQSVGFPPAS